MVVVISLVSILTYFLIGVIVAALAKRFCWEPSRDGFPEEFRLSVIVIMWPIPTMGAVMLSLLFGIGRIASFLASHTMVNGDGE